MKREVITCDEPVYGLVGGAAVTSECPTLASTICVICNGDFCKAHTPDYLKLSFEIVSPANPSNLSQQIRPSETFVVQSDICGKCAIKFRQLRATLGGWPHQPFQSRLAPVFKTLCDTIRSIEAAERLGTKQDDLRKIANGESP